jgi:hypothetical protein
MALESSGGLATVASSFSGAVGLNTIVLAPLEKRFGIGRTVTRVIASRTHGNRSLIRQQWSAWSNEPRRDLPKPMDDP